MIYIEYEKNYYRTLPHNVKNSQLVVKFYDMIIKLRLRIIKANFKIVFSRVQIQANIFK